METGNRADFLAEERLEQTLTANTLKTLIRNLRGMRINAYKYQGFRDLSRLFVKKVREFRWQHETPSERNRSRKIRRPVRQKSALCGGGILYVFARRENNARDGTALSAIFVADGATQINTGEVFD
jgi:hypothetical protein